MPYTRWNASIYESVEDLQTLWHMFSTVASIPLPMILFVALSGCLVVRRDQ
jgi:hypothetical protein